MSQTGPTGADEFAQRHVDAPAPSDHRRILRFSPLLALVFAVGHFATFGVFTLPLKTDIRYFLYFAWRVAEGETPHLDLFDPKTQLATFAGALLYRFGDAIGVEPLFAIRLGFLAFAAIGAWLAYFVHRRIASSAIAGWLGVLAITSFGLLGELPAQGNVPKLLMTLFASLAAILVGRRSWFAAGVAAGLAFMDWQIGAVVGISVAVTAVLTGAGPGALVRMLLGTSAGLLPFVIYFASRGALAVALDQTIASAFFRGSVSAEGWSPMDGLRLLATATLASAQGQAWLVVTGLLGLPIAARRLWRARASKSSTAGERDPGATRVLLCATLSHLGVLGFSLIDFQARGDSLVVLHAAAFFLTLFLFAVFQRIARVARARCPEPLARWAPATLGVLVILVARPGPLRAPYDASWHRGSLQEQRDLARDLEKILEGRSLALVEHSEMLFLMQRVNPLPFIYWNAASWGHYRESESESGPEALRRLLDSSAADAWIVTSPIPSRRVELFGIEDPGPAWRVVRIPATRDSQALLVHLRRGS